MSTDGGIIAAIVVLSVGLGFVNEYRSEVAVAALHDSIHHEALVWRDGTQQRVDVRDLVPGDVIDLRVGEWSPPTCVCSMQCSSNATRRC